MHDVQDNEAESLPYSGVRGLQKKNCHFDPILHTGHLQSPCEKFLTTESTEDTEKKDEIYCFLPRFAASVLSVFSVFSVVRFFIWTLQVS